MIIVNSENTSVTNRRCIRIVRTGETVYVYIIIFDLYVRNIWKASGIRLKGSLGSVEVITDSGILPGDPDRYGIRRVNLSGIPDPDHSRNRDTIQVYHQSEGREHPARDYTGRCCRADHTEDDHLRCIQEHKGNHPALHDR